MADMGGADYMSTSTKIVSVTVSHISTTIRKRQSNEIKSTDSNLLKIPSIKPKSEVIDFESTMFIDKTVLSGTAMSRWSCQNCKCVGSQLQCFSLFLLSLPGKKRSSDKTFTQYVLANVATVFLADSMNVYVYLFASFTDGKKRPVWSYIASQMSKFFKIWLVKRTTPLNNFFLRNQRLLKRTRFSRRLWNLHASQAVFDVDFLHWHI